MFKIYLLLLILQLFREGSFSARAFDATTDETSKKTSESDGIVKKKSHSYAIVTLVSGVESGYSAGAIALGQSIIDVGSKLNR